MQVVTLKSRGWRSQLILRNEKALSNAVFALGGRLQIQRISFVRYHIVGVQLYNSVVSSVFRLLPRAKSLFTLVIDGCEISVDSLQQLEKCKKLCGLSIEKVHFTNESLNSEQLATIFSKMNSLGVIKATTEIIPKEEWLQIKAAILQSHSDFRLALKDEFGEHIIVADKLSEA